MYRERFSERPDESVEALLASLAKNLVVVAGSQHADPEIVAELQQVLREIRALLPQFD